MANASREQMSYTIDCLKTHTPDALELLCDAVLNPVLLQEEVWRCGGMERQGWGGMGVCCGALACGRPACSRRSWGVPLRGSDGVWQCGRVTAPGSVGVAE
eukprot:182649-Chlamydomonas_euryale.AAC.2